MEIYNIFSVSVILAFTVLSTLILKPHFKVGKIDEVENRDEVTKILIEHAHGIECPRNFTLHLMINGTHLFQIQTRHDHTNAILFESCEIADLPSLGLPWLREIPIDATIVDERESKILDEACEKVSYSVLNHSQDAGPDEIEVPIEDIEDGYVSSDMDPSSLFRGIFPGTLWCGFGNLASDIYSKLGDEVGPDECCRTHDLCKPIIEPFITKYHYRNPSFFPISHCSCDVRLYNCFRKVNNTAANEIGRLFFNFARMRCFVFEVRNVCTETWFGYCWKKATKCAAVVRENPIY